ncbi:uncharacterized protein LOC143331355 [Chaetodon auriga]|uniref:uncharacterized protein LOC143331355 n=1 Tax=Chaetodon auriga TaxID=39042 RepID=UPI004032BF4C
MAREIHAKELMLQKKLCRVEEKIRQRIQEDSVNTAAGDDQKSEEERPKRGQAERGKTQTKTRLSERQRSESVRSGEIMQEIRQEDVKQLRKRQDQRNEHRMRNIHEEERARWKGREIEVAQSPHLQRKGCNGTHEVIVRGQELSGDLNKSRWKNVKEHTRRKGEGEEDNCMWGETGVKAKEREQNTTSVGEKDWTREKKFRERTSKDMYSADERDMPQMSQQKTSHRAATENHTGAGRKQSVEPLLPPVSSSPHSSRPEQGEDRPIGNTYDGLQLLPCTICNRKFVSKRLEVHVQICTKVKQSHRRVFNSYINRIKGTKAEEYWKTHSRPKTPEKKKLNQKANTRNLHEGQRSAGTSQPRCSK